MKVEEIAVTYHQCGNGCPRLMIRGGESKEREALKQWWRDVMKAVRNRIVDEMLNTNANQDKVVKG